MTTDYSGLKLTVSPSPHIRGTVTTRAIMQDVILAMLPALAFSAFWFGIRTLLLTGVSVAACVIWELLFCMVLRKLPAISDLSAVVTGMLLVFVCPVDVAWWQLVFGAFVAIVLVKQLFGGIGRNFWNPALVGGMLTLLLFGSGTPDDLKVTFDAGILVGQPESAAAAPMSYLRGEDLEAAFRAMTEEYSLLELFLGKTGGAIGEVCCLALLAGGIYLMGRRIISWHIPVGCIAAVALLALIFPCGEDSIQWMLYSIGSGGLLLGAFFMATDYTTSPVTDAGRLIYGVICGILVVLLRGFVSPERGVYYAILIANCATPLLDRVIRPVRFGAQE